jgi:hypothetical protein
MTKLRIFVRRGALRRFHRLTRDAEGLPVSVEWDRREGERRTDVAPAPVETERPSPGPDAAATANHENADRGEKPEQRRSDRRNDPPFTWTAAEFVVVNDPPDES